MEYRLEAQPKTRLDYARHGPSGIKAQANLERVLAQSSLEQSLMELVRLRASQINGCAFCIDKHHAEAIDAGESERRLNATVMWRETPFFNDRERAALAWTEAVTLVADSHIPDALWEEVHSHFTDPEMVDLTLLIGSINTWNRIAIAFRQMPTAG